MVPVRRKHPIANLEKSTDHQEDFFIVDGYKICQTDLTLFLILFFSKYVN